MRSFLVVLGLVLALSGAQATAPFYSEGENPIDNEFIVVLFSNTTTHQRDALLSQLESLGATTLHTYSGVLTGFASRMEEKLVTLLLENPLVKYVERNLKVTLEAEESCTTQDSAPWGLSRITHPGARKLDAYSYSSDNGGDGEGVVAYVIDTGILLTHVEFEGRAEFGFSSFEGTDEPSDDCNGHGTHVAGTIGGANVGVARESTLVAVKVLSCEGSGSNAGVVAGVAWAAENCKSRVGEKNRCVANMSLGGGKSQATNDAVGGAVDSGVVMVVAAGNENSNACSKSPASSAKAITVGSTEEVTQDGVNRDQRSSFSNFGNCVDIFGPGSLIQSAWIDVEGYTENGVYATISGTSMACPHVAGVATQYVANQGDSPAAASDFLDLLVSKADNDAIDLACTGFRIKAESKVESCLQSPNAMLQSLSCYRQT